MPNVPQPLKCVIRNLDTNVDVAAYFNPKELSIDKKVPWNKHKSTKANNPVLEFTDAEPKDLSIELLFDGYEKKTDVYETYVKKLEEFTKIIDEKKRPPMVIFLWGIFGVSLLLCLLVGVVLWGSVVGSMLPFVLRRLGFDPATASAPLVATLVDVTGVLIYFTLATQLLRGTLL